MPHHNDNKETFRTFSMVKTLQNAGTMIKAIRSYFSEEKIEEKKIQEKGIRMYIEEYQDASRKHLSATQ